MCQVFRQTHLRRVDVKIHRMNIGFAARFSLPIVNANPSRRLLHLKIPLTVACQVFRQTHLRRVDVKNHQVNIGFAASFSLPIVNANSLEYG